MFSFQSAVRGVEWPAVPSPRAAGVLSLLFQLEQTQWWPAATIADLQFRQLDLLLDHVERSVPFYAERLRALDRAPCAAMTLERWRRMPILTRAEAQESAASLVSDALPADHGATFPLRTSGSTGRPLRTLGTALTQLFWVSLTLRDHGWHRRDLDQKLAVIRQFEKPHVPGTTGSVAPNWGATTEGVVHTAPGVSLHIDRTVREQADWLRRERPRYLLTYPSNAYA
ncbi:MAG: phenylacetate--CoA ligase family protein, partial [Actinobacteria bacterium]|nr:phenylacetate--CoA ligase family protein [Actinomycetota bacterium]